MCMFFWIMQAFGALEREFSWRESSLVDATQSVPIHICRSSTAAIEQLGLVLASAVMASRTDTWSPGLPLTRSFLSDGCIMPALCKNQW
jgi:hypothetical protein